MKKHLVLAVVLAALGTSTAAMGSPPTHSGLCVDPGKSDCFATLQAAIDAAPDGAAIEIAAGTFAGGVTITKSVRLEGVSAGATVIQGGGPVLRIGQFEGDNGGLQVAINRVTITGGVNDDAGFAAGGGIFVPQSAGQAVGATVTIDDSVITGNVVGPKQTFSSPAPCGSVPFSQCAFASGGGIANGGTLTLTDTRITDNVAGSAGITSGASGGGIANNKPGTLTLIRSVVSGNAAAVSAPNGRFTDGGGISDTGVVTMRDSLVVDNTSSVAAAVASFFPFDVEEEANAGGIDLSDGSTATIERSRISRNSVTSTNTAGDVEAESGGIDSDGSLLLVDSSVDHNSAVAAVPPDSGFLTEADGGGIQVQGVTILRHSRVGQLDERNGDGARERRRHLQPRRRADARADAGHRQQRHRQRRRRRQPRRRYRQRPVRWPRTGTDADRQRHRSEQAEGEPGRRFAGRRRLQPRRHQPRPVRHRRSLPARTNADGGRREQARRLRRLLNKTSTRRARRGRRRTAAPVELPRDRAAFALTPNLVRFENQVRAFRPRCSPEAPARLHVPRRAPETLLTHRPPGPPCSARPPFAPAQARPPRQSRAVRRRTVGRSDGSLSLGP
jgi:hypothetical protein